MNFDVVDKTLVLNSPNIEIISAVKTLGDIFNENMPWDAHGTHHY